MSRSSVAIISVTCVAMLLPRCVESALEEPLSPRIQECVERGDFKQAVASAESILIQVRADPAARPHEIATFESRLAGYRQEAELPESTRKELAKAERITKEIKAALSGGKWTQAESLATRQTAIRRRCLPHDHQELFASLAYLAASLCRQFRWADAERVFSEAVPMQERLTGRDHPWYITNQATWGYSLWQTGQMELGEKYYREALTAYRRNRLDDTDGYAIDMADYALLRYRRGDLSGAEALLRESIARQPNNVATEGLLERVLIAEGDYVSAVAQAKDYLGRYGRPDDPDGPIHAILLGNVGRALFAAGRVDEAEPYLRQVLSCAIRRHGRQSIEAGNAQFELARALHRGGSPAAAESLYLRGIDLRGARNGRDLDYATTLGDYATFLREEARYPEAERRAQEALAVLEEAPSPAPRTRLSALYTLGLVQLAQAHADSADRALGEAAAIYEQQRREVDRSLRRATVSLPNPYPPQAAARLEGGRDAAAWESTERGLARTLNDILVSSPMPVAQDSAAALDSLELAVADADREIEEISRVSSDAARAGRLGEAVSRRRWTQAKAAAMRARLTAADSDTSLPVFDLPRVQSALDDETAIIGWLDIESRAGSWNSWAYVIRSSGPVSWVDLSIQGASPSERDPYELPGALREAIAAGPGMFDRGEESSDLALLMRRLNRGRLTPLEGSLRGVRRLVVVPAGAMLGIPIECLEAPSGELVCERYIVSYAPSATVFTRLREEARRRRRLETAVLLVGDPVYSEAPVEQASFDRTRPEVLRGVLRGDPDALAELPSLPESRVEIQRIAATCPSAKILLGLDASEESLVHLVGGRRHSSYSTIHLATHALVDDERPERSALVLSQVGLSSPVERAISDGRSYDGLLRAEEIVHQWKLDADLVTLSACETGLGRAAGGEGYLGLAHAFFQAGARSVLVSLWKVDDRATALLMQRFYESRAGRHGPKMSKSEALREAKLYLRSYVVNDEMPYRHPLCWAGFVLIGDDGRP